MQIRTNSRVLLLLGSLMAFAALIVLSGRWHSGEQVQAQVQRQDQELDTSVDETGDVETNQVDKAETSLEEE